MADLKWNAKRDGRGYWTTSKAGDELVIWGSSKDRDGFTLTVLGEVPVRGVLLAEAKAAAEQWVAAHLPKQAPVTAGAWSIDDAGNLWKDGEYIGRIYEDNSPHGTDGRHFYAQGVYVTEGAGGEWGTYRRHLSIGSSSARTITQDEHAEMRIAD